MSCEICQIPIVGTHLKNPHWRFLPLVTEIIKVYQSPPIVYGSQYCQWLGALLACTVCVYVLVCERDRVW